MEDQLGLFSKTNWITVLVPLLLASSAGSAFFLGDKRVWIVGGAALLGALLTAIHKGLNCEAHQAQCRQLLQAYRGLAVRYRTLWEIEKDDGVVDLLVLEESLARLRESDTITYSQPNQSLNPTSVTLFGLRVAS